MVVFCAAREEHTTRHSLPACQHDNPLERGVQDGGLGIMTEACEREARSLALEKAYVHQVYQQITDASDSLPERGRAWPRVKQFLSELEPGSLVCDVGCGNGKYLNVNPSVFKMGADRCHRLAQVAREKDHEVLICDNLSLPFRDESFDAVLSIAVIHHFATTDRRVQALKELARVLRIGGRLIISVWAMEQRHRKFESQDVLVPWHRPQHLSTPSLEFTSTATTTSEEDGPPPYHAYTQTSDSESARSQRTNNGLRKRGRSRYKGRSIDPGRPLSSSQSSSSLSSPNETCYSFVRRALQKLAGGKRGGSGRHRPWFLETWSTCTRDPPPMRYDPDGCEDIDIEDIQDLPIELRRLEEETDLPQRRLTLACSEHLSSSVEISLGYKSKSLSDILTVNQRSMVRSCSSVPSLDITGVPEEEGKPKAEEKQPEKTICVSSVVTSQPKPRLVKQKQSLCEEDLEDEGGDQPTDMRDLVKRLPEFKVSISGGGKRYGSVFKQSSMNEELMSTERLREKERVRQNIQKQTSLNEEFLFRRQRTLDSIRDTLFSTSTAKRFQLLKDGLTNKIKNSTTGIEKVAGASFKNGFVRILQGWKSEVPAANQSRPTPPTPPPHEVRRANTFDEKNGNGTSERRHSKEDGSDSSKDSSLQSDTSVDSEDSFASVIFIPKPDLVHANSETSPPSNTSPTVALSSPTMHSPQPTSPKLKTSLPTSPKLKSQTPTSPIMKQPSLPCKYQAPTSPNFKTKLPTSPIGLTKQHSLPTSSIFKYQIPPLSPGFLKQNDPQPNFQQKVNLQTFQPKTHNTGITICKQMSADAEVPDQVDVKTPPALEEPKPDTSIGEILVPDRIEKTVETVTELPSAAQVPKKEVKSLVSDISKPKTGATLRQSFPLVRRPFSATGSLGQHENLTKPLPKLMSLELFNPETDDVDSDSSGKSSPDSISSVISVLTEELSVDSHDAHHTKPSPSDGHSNSNSMNDSDLNLSDQSISSLPNSKSPEFLISRSPENQSKSPESLSRSSDASGNSKSSEKKMKVHSSASLTKTTKNPEYFSSSSESLSKSPDIHKNEDYAKPDDVSIKIIESKTEGTELCVQKPKVPERSSSKSPEAMKIRAGLQRQSSKEDQQVDRTKKRLRDEIFVAPTCETMDELDLSPKGKGLSPSKSLIEAAADVASSLEGAVDAVIQSSPRARRKQLEMMESDSLKVLENGYMTKKTERREKAQDDDVIATMFKKCEVKPVLNVRHEVGKKKSPEYISSHNEPYPDFEFCKIKCQEDELERRYSLDKSLIDPSTSTENMPLLSSFDQGSNQSLGCYESESEVANHKLQTDRMRNESKRKRLDASEGFSPSLEAGSSWSLGRSEKFRSSLLAVEKRQKNTSTWSLNRYETIAKIPYGELFKPSEGSIRRGRRYRHEHCSEPAGARVEDREPLDKSWVEQPPQVPERPIVRIIHEDMSVSSPTEETPLGIRQRRNFRSQSLSLYNTERLSNTEMKSQAESWDEECRQHLSDFADRLSETLLAEIDQYREQGTQPKSDARYIFSSLPAGLEHIDDPYLTRLSEELLDLTKLSAELKERNHYLASLSDEDLNRELQLSKNKLEVETNPFLSSSFKNEEVTSSNPFSSKLDSNPFLTDPNDPDFDPFTIHGTSVTSSSSLNFDDAFVPFKIDSPPKNRQLQQNVFKKSEENTQSQDRTVEGSEEAQNVEKVEKVEKFEKVQKVEAPVRHTSHERLCGRNKRDRRQNLMFIKSASLDDSHTFLTRSTVKQPVKADAEKIGESTSEKENVVEQKEELPSNQTDMVGIRVEIEQGKSPETRASADITADLNMGLPRDASKMTIASSLGHSIESSDPDISMGSRRDLRVLSLECSMDTELGSSIQRDTSKVTITSSLGHSMESSDPEASCGTGSGSECSRRDISRVTASTASLGHSMESSDPGDVSERTGSGSDFSRKETSSGGTGRTASSTASLGPESGSDCSKDARYENQKMMSSDIRNCHLVARYADRRTARCDGRSSSEETPRRVQLIRQKAAIQEPLETFTKTESFEASLNGSTSQESLPSDNGGGAITYHRYYHVFREGELDQLIEKYVDNLHIISSYYDHANWCLIAEKVQVWTI